VSVAGGVTADFPMLGDEQISDAMANGDS